MHDGVRWVGTPEYQVVQSHKNSIRNSHLPKNASYAGMPFHPAWDKEQGGRPVEGARWIVANLGRKPGPDYEMHILERPLGFVPGNLAWVPRRGHKQEEMVTKLLLENQQLRHRLAALEKQLDKTIGPS